MAAQPDTLVDDEPPRDEVEPPCESDGADGPAAAAIRRRERWLAWVFGVLAGLIGGAIIYAVMRRHLASDFPAHMGYTVELIDGHAPRGEFLFFLLNAVFAGFSTGLGALERSLAFVLAMAIGAKVWLSMRFVGAEQRARLPIEEARPLAIGAGLAVFLCAFAVALPVRGHRYLGQIPPNVWHNSTTIVLMPFALALFWTTLRFLQTGERRWIWWSLPLVALNLAAKPSFMLCLLPAFGLLALLRFRLTRALLWAILLGAVAVVLLFAQSEYVYNVDPTTVQESAIAVLPLAVWHYFSTDIPLSILASFVFPLTALLLGGPAVWRSAAVRYAVLLIVIAVAEYAFLAETGEGRGAGNFTWGAIVAMWVLFVALVSALVPWYQERRAKLRKLAVAAAFLVQAGLVVPFMQHWFASGAYL